VYAATDIGRRRPVPRHFERTLFMTQAFKTRLLSAFLTALVVFQTGGPVRAEEKATPQTYVILIGISHYNDKQIKPRPHAEEDAKALYELFTNKEYRGVPEKNIHLLLGSVAEGSKGQLATRENILKALHSVDDVAKANDTVLFAFIGEGGPLGSNGDRHGYFAVDSSFKGRDKDAVSADEIGEALKGLKSNRFCAFLDVDLKGFTDGGPGIADASLGSPPYKEFTGDDGTEEHGPVHGRVVFLATTGLSPSLDLKDHGLFTTALLEGLKGGADKDGYEPDGVVTVDELSQFIEKRTRELARENGKTKEEKEQQSFALYNPPAHFVLTTNPQPAAKARERLEKFEKLAKELKLPASQVAEGRQLLERMPRLEAQRKLRMQYQELADGKITLAKFTEARAALIASTKLNPVDAQAFAKEVWEATDLIKDNYVKEESQGDMVGWAIRGLYRRIDEKIPAEIETSLKGVKDQGEDDLKKLLVSARVALGQREDLDKHKDIDIALQRMLSHLDPYTTYVDKEQLDRFNQDIQQSFTGIGIQIRKDSATDQLLVVTPIKGSPAYKTGLLAGDVITRITREVDSKGHALNPPEVIETKGLALNEAVKKILGKEDTKVHLTVQREGSAKPLEFDITRGRVEVETVLGWKRNTDDEWNFMKDPEKKIGYVRLTSFSRHTYRDLQRVMHELSQQGVRGLVLDLRFNPGGLLESAVRISDLFVDDGLIVSIRPRVGREQKLTGTHEGSLLDFPMVCMVNGYSASGSEIVSAALQDHKRAIIIGERSYGKGSVQNIQDFHDGQIKLTTASFWRPSGKNLNKSSTGGRDEDEWGVTPDKVVKLNLKGRRELEEALHDAEIIPRHDRRTAEQKPEYKDAQLDEALTYLRDQIGVAAKLPAAKPD
jgi:carboxyl-terminal processing protease